MNKYLLICPQCGSSMVTSNPDAAVWELCPSCLKYVWDQDDIKMAELIRTNSNLHGRAHAGMGNAATH